MKIHLVFPVLPPAIDGIGDYTACLARALATDHQVAILTGQGPYDAVADLDVRPVFAIDHPAGVAGIETAVEHDRPDWLVVQYNPFSYGRWGYNPHLPRIVERIKQRIPGVRIALTVHEPYVPFADVRSVIMSAWQRPQLHRLAGASDIVFFSIAPWTEAFAERWPDKRVLHLPVGSNIPRCDVQREAMRERLGIPPDMAFIGVFGSAHPSRLLHFVAAAVAKLQREGVSFHLLSIGAAGGRLREMLPTGVPFTDAGILSGPDVSRHLAAMDVYLAPFRKGVSTRRGSYIAGLQHGVATASTSGIHTDRMLLNGNNRSFILTPDNAPQAFVDSVSRLVVDTEFRSQIAQEGRSFFDRHLSWEQIARRMVAAFAIENLASASSEIEL